MNFIRSGRSETGVTTFIQVLPLIILLMIIKYTILLFGLEQVVQIIKIKSMGGWERPQLAVVKQGAEEHLLL